MSDTVIETGINQLIHPHPGVRARLEEHSLSDCEYGCKYYADPKRKGVLYLHHNPSYGCKKTRANIEAQTNASIFEGQNFWMVPLKDRVDKEVWEGLAVTTGAKVMTEGMETIRKRMSNVGYAARKAAKSMGEFAKNAPEKNRVYGVPNVRHR